MAEYINREELIENLNKFAPEYYNALMNQLITKQPTADVVEVKHGEWVCLEAEIGYFACSECDHRILRAECNYCPNCGAKMDGGKIDDL